MVRAALPQVITAVGSLRSDESVTLRPEVAGRIAMIGFAEGQRVQKGSVLVRLDPTVNEAEVKQARANMTLAKSKYDRAVDLAKSNFISGQARDEAESNMKVADAALAVAEAKLAKTEIKAPFSGIIGLRQVSVGDYVKEGADLVNLEAVDPLKVDFRVPEIYLRQVRAGQALEIALDAIPGRTYAGRVFAINPLVDAAGRAIVIRAQVSNPDTSLRPGMFARVRLITEERQDAIVVPEQALVPFGSEQFVFKVVDGKAQRARVEIGQRGPAPIDAALDLGAAPLEGAVVLEGQEGLPARCRHDDLGQPVAVDVADGDRAGARDIVPRVDHGEELVPVVAAHGAQVAVDLVLGLGEVGEVGVGREDHVRYGIAVEVHDRRRHHDLSRHRQHVASRPLPLQYRAKRARGRPIAAVLAGVADVVGLVGLADGGLARVQFDLHELHVVAVNGEIHLMAGHVPPPALGRRRS